MHARLYRAVAAVALLGATLVSPVRAGAPQDAIVLITLVDGVACRGPIEGTTFALAGLRANYACTDGRWILGEPLSLADGRQTAMLARTVAQGQPVRDDVPCTDIQCPIALEQAEVATAATLPRIVSYTPFPPSSSRVTCTFQDDKAFWLGGVRANYLCDPTWYQDPERAGAYYNPTDAEYWILGGLYDTGMGGDLQGSVVVIQRQGAQVGTGGNNRSQYPILCKTEVCVLATYQITFGRVGSP
jgi:hypothetical protein